MDHCSSKKSCGGSWSSFFIEKACYSNSFRMSELYPPSDTRIISGVGFLCFCKRQTQLQLYLIIYPFTQEGIIINTGICEARA